MDIKIFNKSPQIFQLLTNRIQQMRPHVKDIYILFKRLPKYAILILKIKKIEHNKIQQKNVNRKIYFKTKFICEQTNLF